MALAGLCIHAQRIIEGLTCNPLLIFLPGLTRQTSSALQKLLLITDLFNNDCIVLHRIGKNLGGNALISRTGLTCSGGSGEKHKIHNNLTADTKVIS